MLQIMLTESEARGVLSDLEEQAEDLQEGISDFLKRIRMKKFEAVFFERGNETVYFAYSPATKMFAKAVFVNNQLGTTQRYSTAREMEEDIKRLESEGYTKVRESGIKRFLKTVSRILGRIIKIDATMTFIAGTLIIILAATAGTVSFAYFGLPTFLGASLVSAFKWKAGSVMVDMGKVKALKRDHGEEGVAAAHRISESFVEFEATREVLTESISTGDDEKIKDSIIEMIRHTILQEAQPINEN